VELTKIIMRSDNADRQALLENITNASILTWQHINLHGIYDFINLLGVDLGRGRNRIIRDFVAIN